MATPKLKKIKGVKVVSNGTPQGTHVFLPDGEEMQGVQALALNASCDQLPNLHLVLTSHFEVEVTSNATTSVKPSDKRKGK